MVLGQSAALAAGLALEEKAPVQNIVYTELRQRLLAAGQVLEWRPKEAKQTAGNSPR
jgi:hypothetical protein